MKLKINMLSKAESAKGQGVGSAYREQVTLIQKIENFDVSINSRSGKFDIYHIHSVNPSYKLRMNKRHLNIVYVHFIPAKNHESIKLPRFANWVFDKYVERFYRKADELVVVNPCFISDLEALKIPTEKITYIPNFVNHDNFKPLPSEEIDKLKEKYHLPKDKFIVLGCGQIQTRKGFDEFVETAKNCPDLFFAWVGGFSFGRIMHGYKKYKKLLQNLPQNMIHIPIIDRIYMNEIFNSVDVLFMPSHMELFPMTILEMVNVHKPILLKNLSLYKPILFSKYASGDSIEDYSKELNRLANDITYYKVQSENSKFISDFYNEQVLMNTWRDYYQRVFIKWKERRKQ